MNRRLENKTAIVTGAGRGIGRAIARCFAAADAERRIAALHPPGRIARPDEVAMTALFLASDEAPFIDAACIPVDGGRSVVYHE